MDKKRIIIKRATLLSVNDILKIHRECVKKINSTVYPPQVIKEWLSQINKENLVHQLENSSWLILELNKKIIGFAQYNINTQELYQINISPALQNTGYGKYLFYYIEKIFIKNKKRYITLNSTINAVNFYKKLGFKKIKSINFKLFREKVRMIKMKKKLTSTKYEHMRSRRMSG